MTEREKLKIAIIDYGMGNLFSVLHAFESLGARPLITTDPAYLSSSDAAVLPGVGAFGDAMKNLHHLKLIAPIKAFVESGRPFMGVCLGMQLLFSESEEFGLHQGLGIINGRVARFPQVNSAGKPVRVPQIGWNAIRKPPGVSWENTPLERSTDGEFMYFVHSYCGHPADSSWLLTETEYEGVKYCSTVGRGKIIAFQFHPEKSGPAGIRLYEKWLEGI